MLNINSLILTTDLSENSEAATPYAVMLAKKFNATIYLVHVFEEILYTGVLADGSMGYNPTAWLEKAESERKEKLHAMALAMSTSGNVRVIPQYLRGNPITELLQFAKTNCVECIVMATHGRTGFSHLLFGSVAEKVVRMSSCPVFTVKPPIIMKTQERILAEAPGVASDVVL